MINKTIAKIFNIGRFILAVLSISSLVLIYLKPEKAYFGVFLTSLFSTFFIVSYALDNRLKSLIEKIYNNSLNNRLQVDYKHNFRFLLYAAIGIAGAIVTIAVIDVDTYYQLIEEDGPIEYTSSIFWFLSSVLLIASSNKKHFHKEVDKKAFLTLLLAAFFFVCGGEEISWGQRIFSITTPESLKSINVQDEITLHNIGSISVFSNIFFLISISFFFVLPWLAKKHQHLLFVLHFLRLPLPNKTSIQVFAVTLVAWLIIGGRFGTLGFHPYTFYAEQYYTQMDDEFFEFFTAFSFFVFSCTNYFKSYSQVSEFNK